MGLRNTIIINGTQELQNKDWKFYNNTRFGFSVLVPGNWIIGLESDNGDGVELYIGNPNINICVFASFYIKDVSSSYDNINKPGYRMQRLILDNGLEAELIIGKLSNKVSLEMIQILKNIEYHFNAFITDEFFHDNEKTLIDIIKSYDALKDGWEKGECISANFN